MYYTTPMYVHVGGSEEEVEKCVNEKRRNYDFIYAAERIHYSAARSFALFLDGGGYGWDALRAKEGSICGAHNRFIFNFMTM